MTEKNNPSILRIIQVDYLAHLAFMFLLIIAGIVITLQVLTVLAGGSDQAAGFWPLAIANAFMALLLIGFRMYAIFSVFSNGTETSGVIMSVTPSRDRVTLEFAYTWMGERLVREVIVAKDARITALTAGHNVTVLVDRGEPRRVLICDLYTSAD